MRIGGRDYLAGGVVSNVPIATVFQEGYRRILAIGLVAVDNLGAATSSWTKLVAWTLQLGLHH